jgi:copper chaperone
VGIFKLCFNINIQGVVQWLPLPFNQEIKMLRFYIPNMTCGGCAKSVTATLLSVDPQAHVETDPPAREVRVDSAMDESAFLAVLSEAGYPDRQ